MTQALPLLVVHGLGVRFPQARRRMFTRVPMLDAVLDVDLTVPRGHILGLVGESGSGKSSAARAIAGLVRPCCGTITLDGQTLPALLTKRPRAQRHRIQMVFQDPYASLDPRLSAGETIAEPLRNYGLAHGREALRQACALMERVGLEPVHCRRYPHEFSGGQRQRIGIARALAARPDLLICDEPVSALDVSVQAQILNLLADLRRDLGLGMLFIAHDLAVVRHLADEVAVMYRGRIVERAARDALFAHPAHPYTRALLRAVPRPDPDAVPRPPQGPADQTRTERGCAYAPRCSHADDACLVVPELHAPADGHEVACHKAKTEYRGRR